MQAWFPRCQSAIARCFLLIGWFGLLTASSGCLGSSRHEAQAQSEQREEVPGDQSVLVQTAIAQPDSLDNVLEYTGTTAPIQQVNLRARVEGQLVSLAVNVGDFVEAGQTLGRIDDDLLITDVNEAQAELAALQSEVAQTQAQVDNAQALVEQARVEYQQAQADNARLQSLAADGAVSQQQADLAETAMKTAEQSLRSAQQGVQTQQQAVVAAQGRVNAQQAVVAQTEEQRSYTLLKSPITGSILERITEAGSMLQPGDEIVRLGDFSTVKIIVQASELDLAQIRVGQSVDVSFDAFPGRSFTGEVARISPAADPVARLVPVEVTLPNPNGQIGSGLLARVNFAPRASQQVVIPDSALETGTNSETPTLFVIEGSGDNAKVIARQVQLGDRANGRIEIRAGLEPGEPFVIKSSAPLEDGQTVKLSILSETPSE
ncbi:MAG: efflux RND transporter periplasmic adaptor subunit [Elainellaceae cyanobacterium]